MRIPPITVRRGKRAYGEGVDGTRQYTLAPDPAGAWIPMPLDCRGVRIVRDPARAAGTGDVPMGDDREAIRLERLLRLVATLASLLVILWVGSGGADARRRGSAVESAPGTPRGIGALMDGGIHPWLRHPELSDVRDSLRAFYGRRHNAPCWIQYGRPSSRARAWIAALGRLDDYGIPADDCDVLQVADSLAAIDPDRARSDEEMGDLDVAVTTSIARALRALHSGRLDPARVDSNLILLHHPLALSVTLDAIASSGDPRTWIDRVQPSFRQYREMVQSLARYREFADDPANALPQQPPRLNVGRRSGRVATLRRTLEWTGDLRWGSSRGTASDSIAEARLVAAIGRFQRRHQLQATGRLDSLTWNAVRGGLTERIEQMGRTLEQYRWLPHELTAPLLFVNIPAFRLVAMDRLDEPASEMLQVDVVVGTAYKTQTPVLTAALTSIDFMPDWDVPPSIATGEVQPEALKDSTYLGRNHMDLIRNMRVLPPTRANIELIGKGVRVRQRPGPDNPLGRIKFVMPNRFDIYLHDTPARQLFQARQRDFSHGCIRLGNALGLAKYVLRERPDWTPGRIDSAMKDTVTVKVRLPVPMLVAIVYATAEARESGRVAFLPDVYGHDRTLQLLLAGAPRDTLVAERWRAMAARHRLPVTPDSLPHPPSMPPAMVPHPPGVLPPVLTPVRKP